MIKWLLLLASIVHVCQAQPYTVNSRPMIDCDSKYIVFLFNIDLMLKASFTYTDINRDNNPFRQE